MQIISDYRALLANTLRNGIHGAEDMTEFIGKEDAIFRAFLPYLCSIGDEDISDITRDTEKCCLQSKYPLIPTLWMIFEDSTFAFRSGDKHRSRRIYGK